MSSGPKSPFMCPNCGAWTTRHAKITQAPLYNHWRVTRPSIAPSPGDHGRRCVRCSWKEPISTEAYSQTFGDGDKCPQQQDRMITGDRESETEPLLSHQASISDSVCESALSLCCSLTGKLPVIKKHNEEINPPAGVFLPTEKEDQLSITKEQTDIKTRNPISQTDPSNSPLFGRTNQQDGKNGIFGREKKESHGPNSGVLFGDSNVELPKSKEASNYSEGYAVISPGNEGDLSASQFPGTTITLDHSNPHQPASYLKEKSRKVTFSEPCLNENLQTVGNTDKDHVDPNVSSDETILLEQQLIFSGFDKSSLVLTSLEGMVVENGMEVLEEIRSANHSKQAHRAIEEAQHEQSQLTIEEERQPDCSSASSTPRISNRKEPPGCVYVGPYDKNGFYHGDGQLVWENGDCYMGFFRHGLRHGKGRLIFADGSMYNGSWELNKKHGRGTRKFSNGNKYVGDFALGQRNGYGQYFFVNGDHYEGGFKDGKMNGFGRYCFQNNDVFEGIFYKGKKHGWGKYRWTNGNIDYNTYCEDEKVGEGVRISADTGKAWKLDGDKIIGKISLKKAEEFTGSHGRGQKKTNAAPVTRKRRYVTANRC